MPCCPLTSAELRGSRLHALAIALTSVEQLQAKKLTPQLQNNEKKPNKSQKRAAVPTKKNSNKSSPI